MSVLISVGLFTCSPKKNVEKPVAPDPSSTDIPALIVTKLDGTPLSAKSLVGHKTILILFQPDCDHCQAEAKQISERLTAFENYTIYFISAAEPETVKKFSEDYKLNREQNIIFATTEVQGIIDSFGPIPAPSVYIYSAEGRLVRKFNGQTELETIVKAL